MWVIWNLSSFISETVLVSVQDRCMVSARCIIGSLRLEVVLMFRQGRCTVCVEHIIGSKIVLDASDGTPR